MKTSKQTMKTKKQANSKAMATKQTKREHKPTTHDNKQNKCMETATK